MQNTVCVYHILEERIHTFHEILKVKEPQK